MDEWINILSQKFLEIWGLIQVWWLPVGAFAGSCWLIIKKIWPWAKGLWEANKKIKNLENEKKYLDLREELLAAKEVLHIAKKDIARLNEQLVIKENVTWKDGILYYNNAEICSRCYDTSSSVDRKTVRLLPSNHEIKGTFYCPECKIHPRTKEGAAQELRKHQEAVRHISGRPY